MGVKKTMALLLGATSLSLSVPAAAAGDEGMKMAAIVGGLASYVYAGLNRSEFSKCDDSVRGFYQYGKDDELKAHTVGVSFADCNLKPKGAEPGFGFRISPAVMFSQWSANAGAGADSASEVTFVPQARYVWDMGATKLDLMFGIGVSFLSETNIGRRAKSTELQFSDEIGIGLSDRSERFRVGYSYRHVSNADIKTPNNNVDFHGFTLTVRLD